MTQCPTKETSVVHFYTPQTSWYLKICGSYHHNKILIAVGIVCNKQSNENFVSVGNHVAGNDVAGTRIIKIQKEKIQKNEIWSNIMKTVCKFWSCIWMQNFLHCFHSCFVVFETLNFKVDDNHHCFFFSVVQIWQCDICEICHIGNYAAFSLWFFLSLHKNRT